MGTEKRARQKAGRQARIEAAQEAQERAKTRARALRIGGGVIVVLLLVAAYALLTRKDDQPVATGTSTTTASTPGSTPGTADANAPAVVPPPPAGQKITGDTPCPNADGTSERVTTFEKAPPMCIDAAKTYTATFDTNQGPIVLALDAKTMPGTTNNFVVLSRYHYYDDTSIFRVDSSIDILQGGSPATNSASDPGPGYTIPDEGGPFTYQAGDLVMARTDAPNSSGAQFFMGTGPNVSNLNSQGTYLLFGKITQGLDIAQGIVASGVPFPSTSPMAGLGSGPKDPVIVNKVTITES